MYSFLQDVTFADLTTSLILLQIHMKKSCPDEFLSESVMGYCVECNSEIGVVESRPVKFIKATRSVEPPTSTDRNVPVSRPDGSEVKREGSIVGD